MVLYLLWQFRLPQFASKCLSEETLKPVGPFCLVSVPGEVKDPSQGVNYVVTWLLVVFLRQGVEWLVLGSGVKIGGVESKFVSQYDYECWEDEADGR